MTAWFAHHVPPATSPLSFTRIAGGHSCLTYIVTDDAGERFILRRPPLGHVLATAHDVVREHKVMHALRDTGVAVPRMLGVCESPDVNDAPGRGPRLTGFGCASAADLPRWHSQNG